MQTFTIVDKAIEFVKEELKNNDGSHDWLHIERVLNNSKKIAKQEKLKGVIVDEEVVSLAAILHDVGDWKYSGSETFGTELVKKFLLDQKYSTEKIAIIERIMKQISFHSELDGIQENFPELAIVQDADRLDAIGAIGISRCMTFAGKKSSPIYDPEILPINIESKQDYTKKTAGSTAINHFYEKLFKIKSMMKTDTGKEMAESRHQYMVQFLDRLIRETQGLE